MPFPRGYDQEAFVPDPARRWGHIYYPPTDEVISVDEKTYKAVLDLHPYDDSFAPNSDAFDQAAAAARAVIANAEHAGIITQIANAEAEISALKLQLADTERACRERDETIEELKQQLAHERATASSPSRVAAVAPVAAPTPAPSPAPAAPKAKAAPDTVPASQTAEAGNASN